MNKQTSKVELPEIAAFGTWAIVLGITLFWLSDHSTQYATSSIILIALFVVYMGCFITVTKGLIPQNKYQLEYVVIAIQLFTTFMIMWLVPLEFLSILTIIWVALLPHFMSLKKSMLVMLFVVILWFTIFSFHHDKDVFFSALLFSTFHAFVILMAHQTRLAEAAFKNAENLNKELQAAQYLLEQATRQNERTRIARDLHDLVGHHLTALIINLQVAGHLSEGASEAKIEQCHSIAKLLLSDVREAVSTMRESQALDFKQMIELMLKNIPELVIHSQIDTELNLDDLDLAKNLLSCIQEATTNCLRHSGAQEFWIKLKHQNKDLLLEMYDNGKLKSPFIKGNGLLGMEERVAQFNGKLEISTPDNGMHLMINIPLQNNQNNKSS